MRKFNIINCLKNSSKEVEEGTLDSFLNELEVALQYVDEFEETQYFDIYDLTYIDENASQYDISEILGISQSAVSKNLNKIDSYIYKMLSKKKYTNLLKIANLKH